MTIISLNINNFGGATNHLACYKKYNYINQYVINWDRWRDENEKFQYSIIDKIKKMISDKKPAVVIFQEYELNNSKGPMVFIEYMKSKGYQVMGVIPKFKASITLFFVKNTNPKEVKIPIIEIRRNELSARDYAIKYGGYIIYGTHVPYQDGPRAEFWDDILRFYDAHNNEKVILLGDFNTFDKSTPAYQKYQKLLNKGAIDLWLEQGGNNNTATELHGKRFVKGRLPQLYLF